MLLNQETFKHRYRQLVYLTKKKGSEPSFTSGLWFDEEGYKYDFWEKAQAELQLETWLQLTDSEIVKLAIKPFGPSRPPKRATWPKLIQMDDVSGK